MKIAILLPTMGTICTELHQWLLLMHSMYDIVEMKTHCSTPIEKAFNNLSLQFLRSDCEYAFIINSDEAPPDRAFDTLLAHDKDIVSGLCFKWDDKHSPLPVASKWGEESQYFEYQFKDGLQQVDRCGFSGVLIKRAAFEAVPVGTYTHQSSAYCHEMDCDWADHTNEFDGDECPRCGGFVAEDGGLFISPEFIWLDEARRQGFEVWVDFGLHIDHYKDHINITRVNGMLVQAGRNTLASVIDIAEQRLNAGEDPGDILDSLIESQGA